MTRDDRESTDANGSRWHINVAIEQNFHDVKEVHGAGQQQVRNVWSNVACWNLSLSLHTLAELWSWRRRGRTRRQRSD